ncbi:hypothetical protein [Pseudomonas savastanoi]|uniref:hypothetical protein n=1 Tax=Pseudomonas savastanoi TaxID=29438 RepID=UPI000F003144|nr:hypothetical protein [Pseudomonas savastanoi]RMM99540.1 hypothetical protein ALQ68_03986 [Pseudomonas savastanoi pv. glycinea]
MIINERPNNPDYEVFKTEMSELVQRLDEVIASQELDPNLVFPFMGFMIPKSEAENYFLFKQQEIDVFRSKTLKAGVFHNAALCLSMNNNNIYKTFDATKSNNSIHLNLYETCEYQLKIHSGLYVTTRDNHKEWILFSDIKDMKKDYPEILKATRQDLISDSDYGVGVINLSTKERIFYFFKKGVDQKHYAFTPKR